MNGVNKIFLTHMNEDMVALCAMLDKIYPSRGDGIIETEKRDFLLFQPKAQEDFILAEIQRLLKKRGVTEFYEIETGKVDSFVQLFKNLEETECNEIKTGKAIIAPYNICKNSMQIGMLNVILSAKERLKAIENVFKTGGFDLTNAEKEYLDVFYGKGK
ncbi:MAG: hypothetical protein FWC51_00320 [Proteobacteria bacterium]|nr:hypothetical protein [Pseudomonadota bacterium]